MLEREKERERERQTETDRNRQRQTEMHTGGRRSTSYTPSKDFEKLDHKNAIKHVNRGFPPRFSHNPKYPPQKNFKMTVHLCRQRERGEREGGRERGERERGEKERGERERGERDRKREVRFKLGTATGNFFSSKREGERYG